MIISKYGIRLVRVKETHIETLRQWRNSDQISRFMEYKEYITPEMQQRWFLSLGAISDFYFMIEYNGKQVGMIHASHVNWREATGEAGLFIYEQNLQSTYIPVMASLAMVDVFFGLFRLERLYAKVMSGNKVAEKYNTNLGFKKMPGQEGQSFQRYELKREDYYQTTIKLRETANHIGGKDVSVLLEQNDLSLFTSEGLFASKPAVEFQKVLSK